jgi:hypothetical protein
MKWMWLFSWTLAIGASLQGNSWPFAIRCDDQVRLARLNEIKKLIRVLDNKSSTIGLFISSIHLYRSIPLVWVRTFNYSTSTISYWKPNLTYRSQTFHCLSKRYLVFSKSFRSWLRSLRTFSFSLDLVSKFHS